MSHPNQPHEVGRMDDLALYRLELDDAEVAIYIVASPDGTMGRFTCIENALTAMEGEHARRIGEEAGHER